MNKKLTLIFATSLFLTLASCSGSNPTDPSTPPSGDIPVTSISLDKTTLTLKEEETYKLTATINPSDATDKTITWSSSKTSFVSVSNEGLVTALSEGSSTITATSSNGKTASCVVTVNKKVDPTPTDIDGVYELITSTPTIGSYVMFVYDGQKDYALKTTAEANYRPGVVVTITSNKIERNDDIAVFKVCEGNSTGTYAFYDVTNKGYLCATNNSQRNYMQLESSITGYSSFTVSSGANKDIEASSGSRNIIRFNYGDVRFSCYASTSTSMKQVSLFEKAADPIYPTEISLSGASDMNINETQTLGVGYLPNETNVKSVTFVSFMPSVASVTNSGLVTALSEGSTTITATARGENGAAIIATKNITVHKVPVTGVTLSESSKEISTRGSFTLSATVSPSNASNKNVTWSTSNPNVATVNNGVVTPVNPGTTVITVTTVDGNKTASCNVTVYEATLPSWTIMIYMCGSNLESGYNQQTGKYVKSDGGMGSANLAELLSVAGQTEDVNVIVETGGSHYWYNSYGMTASKLQRWHVSNKQLVLDESLSTYTSMAKQSTFQSFLKWGLDNYPAERTGVIVWDHGNGMQGCCSDEYDTGWDMLLMNEMKSAYDAVLGGQKLEWIGYDCCLMAMQDIASINADYFNYQISSQESEPGAGWDYTGVVSPLYQNPSISTVDLGKNICNTYHSKVLKTYEEYVKEGYDFYQDFDHTTLSIFDLSRMDAYVDAWEAMVPQLGISSKSKFTTMAGYAQECYAFANTDEETGYGTGTSGVDAYDCYTFLNKLKSKYSDASEYVTEVQSKFNDVVVFKVIGTTYSSHAYGMSVFVATYGQTSKSEYTTNDTKLTAWRDINISYGTFYN